MTPRVIVVRAGAGWRYRLTPPTGDPITSAQVYVRKAGAQVAGQRAWWRYLGITAPRHPGPLRPAAPPRPR